MCTAIKLTFVFVRFNYFQLKHVHGFSSILKVSIVSHDLDTFKLNIRKQI